MTTRRSGALLFLATVFITQTGYNECTGDVLHDPGFDIWCGDELCSWELEKGDVRKVATWHDGDPGVDLVGDEAAISQLSEYAPVDCLRFSLVADVSEDASVALEMDLDDDGTVEYARAIPTSHWAELTYLVELQGEDSIRFRLRKTGRGRAVLAQIRAVDNPECGGETVVSQRPTGSACGGDGECASGACDGARPLLVCAADLRPCETAADCPGGEETGACIDVGPAGGTCE